MQTKPQVGPPDRHRLSIIQPDYSQYALARWYLQSVVPCANRSFFTVPANFRQNHQALRKVVSPFLEKLLTYCL